MCGNQGIEDTSQAEVVIMTETKWFSRLSSHMVFKYQIHELNDKTAHRWDRKLLQHELLHTAPTLCDEIHQPRYIQLSSSILIPSLNFSRPCLLLVLKLTNSDDTRYPHIESYNATAIFC